MKPQIVLYLSLHKSQPKSNNSKPRKLLRILPNHNLIRKRKILQLLRRSLRNRSKLKLLWPKRLFNLSKKLLNRNPRKNKVKNRHQKRSLKLNLLFKKHLYLLKKLLRNNLQRKKKAKNSNLKRLWKLNLLFKSLLLLRKKFRNLHNNKSLKK